MERILPSYPLFVKDPNFSLWMGNEYLNAQNVETWYGETKTLYGFIKTHGKTYCYLGDADKFTPLGIEKAKQTALKITAFSTDYTFICGDTELKLRFVSPLPLTELELLSLPVCYMEYDIYGDKEAEISLFMGRDMCFNNRSETINRCVRGGNFPVDTYECSYMGLIRQLPLSNTGDLIGADWGYYYLAGQRTYFLDENELRNYLITGSVCFSAKDEERYISAISRGERGALLIGYDDRVSIDYFGDIRKGYYLAEHTIFDALTTIWKEREKCNQTLYQFEKDLKQRAKLYGEEYQNVLFASLRQSIASHKLVRDCDGNILWLSKECGSNGCIATVDVSYPSMPLYLLYAPELVKGMMRPILKFARMPVWEYDFAPHDVGTYPICSGEVYSMQRDLNNEHGVLGEGRFHQKLYTHFPVYLLPQQSYGVYNVNKQMPVEECANMLIMFLAVYRADGDIGFFAQNKDLCAKWVQYLVQYGLKPGDQLCTDDFAGHLKNNINLAIKATVGIAAYAELLSSSGNSKGEEYRQIAKKFALEIELFAQDKTHLPLTWDSDEKTFSLKYNLAFDKILGLGLFSSALMEKEVDYYLTKLNEYGVPLDSRKSYTKSDWLMWAAVLTDDIKKRMKFIHALDRFLQESPQRTPFGDWYETENGHCYGFRARTVQGGCFILIM